MSFILATTDLIQLNKCTAIDFLNLAEYWVKAAIWSKLISGNWYQILVSKQINI